jgi:arylmalonate decarboxylase
MMDPVQINSSATPLTLGLLVAPGSGRMPPDVNMLYGDSGVRFISQGLGVGEISPSAFDQVEARILEKARALSGAGAQSIILMGTSLTFYRGPTYTNDLRDEMTAITKVPCTTTSHAIVESMRALGMHRVAVATSYIEELNVALREYLEILGFEVAAIEGLGIRGVDAMRAVPPRAINELSRRVVASADRPDGLFISCTGLNTLSLHAGLEGALGVPVTSSAPAALWHVMRVAGRPTDRPGFGRLFSPASEV